MSEIKVLFHIQENILVDYNMPPADFYVFILNVLLPLFKKQIKEGKIEYKTIVSERVYYEASPEQEEIIHPVVIFDREYRQCFGNDFISHKEMLEYFDGSNFSDEMKMRFSTLHKEKLKDFEPDFIISVGLYNELYNYTFPKAPHIAWQWGTLKRDTSPITHAFDPIGYIKDSYFNHFKEQINSIKLTDEQNQVINQFKSKYTDIIRQKRPENLTKIINKYKKEFDYLLLLPAAIDKSNYFALESDFKHQWDVVTYVLDHTPDNTGVIVTEHTAQYCIDINNVGFATGQLKWLQNKYKNFIYIPELKHYHATSFWILPEVDGVVSVGTTTPLTSTMFDTKVISLAKRTQNAYKDAQGMENILDVLKAPSKDKNPFVYWILTHYNYFSKQIEDETFMYEQLKRWIKKYRTEGITFDWLQKINNEKEICDYILQDAEKRLSNIQDKPLNNHEVIAYERNRYKQHYEDMLAQRDKLLQEKETLLYERGRYKKHYEDMLAQRDKLLQEKKTLFSRRPKQKNNVSKHKFFNFFKFKKQ